jgi:putative hydrolase of the HAD superfamily
MWLRRNFKIIGFDADDTLWINEPYFQETERMFCELLSDFLPSDKVSEELLKTEIQNIELYGYGAKGFMLSMIETAMRISDHKIGKPVIEKIISLGKELLNKPVILLDGIHEALEKMNSAGYKVILATKGDLLDQERKLSKSNIEKYFHHIEIMSDKKESNYRKLLSHMDIAPEDFLMIGNSLKSDIIPVLNIGGYGVYIPYHTTWAHELTELNEMSNNFTEIKEISELEKILDL